MASTGPVLIDTPMPDSFSSKERDTASETEPQPLATLESATKQLTPPSDAGEDSRPFTREETTIIFDWDDTLLSSSWLANNGLRLDEPAIVPAEAQEQLQLLQASVINLLTRAVKCATVIIITNAETGWVELSCKRFLPGVLPHLHGVKILSARSTFESLFPDSPSDWKVQAFFQEICAVYAGRPAGTRKNVLSFGDSVHERFAIHKVTAYMGPNARTKSINFVERPTLEQLKRQVDLVASCIEELVRHGGPLDLMLTIQLLYN